MPTILFAKGSKGEIIRKMQRRLTNLGFDTRGIDGDLGVNTRNSVIRFQEANTGLIGTGEVDAITYERLMGTSIPTVKERSLQLTAAFEGHDFTLAQGNFDGAGITWGIIGFTLKHGEIGKIILAINERHPSLVEQAFGDRKEELVEMLSSSLKFQLAFAVGISLGAGKVRIAEPWRSAFKRFGEMEEVQDLQTEFADRDYFQPALQTAKEYGLVTELGIALAFDIHVQNGGINDKARKRIAEELRMHSVGNEREVRVIIANAVADMAGSRFREDVRSRKLTLAVGTGKVHGCTFVLRNWGLDESKFEG